MNNIELKTVNELSNYSFLFQLIKGVTDGQA